MVWWSSEVVVGQCSLRMASLRRVVGKVGGMRFGGSALGKGERRPSMWGRRWRARRPLGHDGYGWLFDDDEGFEGLEGVLVGFLVVCNFVF